MTYLPLSIRLSCWGLDPPSSPHPAKGLSLPPPLDHLSGSTVIMTMWKHGHGSIRGHLSGQNPVHLFPHFFSLKEF